MVRQIVTLVGLNPPQPIILAFNFLHRGIELRMQVVLTSVFDQIINDSVSRRILRLIGRIGFTRKLRPFFTGV